MNFIPFLILAQAFVAPDAAQPKPSSDMGAALEAGSKSVILIDPKARAMDYVQAFDLLHKDKPTQKIMVRTMGSVFMNVTEMSTSTGGTLLFLKLLSNQGMRTQMVPVEQLMEITYSP